MKLTLDDILTRIDNYIGDENRVNYPLDERIDDINDEYELIYNRLSKISGAELTINNTDRNKHTGTLSAGSNFIPIDTQFKLKIVRVHNDQFLPYVRGFNNQTCSEVTIGTGTTSDDEIPAYHYVVQHDGILLGTTFSTDVNYEIYTYSGFTPFTSTDLTVTPRFHDVGHLLLALGAVRRYYDKRSIAIPQNIASEYKERYRLLEDKYIVNRRFAKRPKAFTRYK